MNSQIGNTTLSAATCLVFLVFGFIFIVLFWMFSTVMGHSIVLMSSCVCVCVSDLRIMNARLIVSFDWNDAHFSFDSLIAQHTYIGWRFWEIACLNHCFVVVVIGIVYDLAFSHARFWLSAISIKYTIQSVRSIKRYSMRECFCVWCLTYITA